MYCLFLQIKRIVGVFIAGSVTDQLGKLAFSAADVLPLVFESLETYIWRSCAKCGPLLNSVRKERCFNFCDVMSMRLCVCAFCFLCSGTTGFRVAYFGGYIGDCKLSAQKVRKLSRLLYSTFINFR